MSQTFESKSGVDSNKEVADSDAPKAELTLVAEDSGSVISKTLRSARLDKGLSTEFISNDTHIPVSYLNSLETEEFNFLSDTIFVIGHLRSYAKYLELDADELVNQFKAYQRRPQNESIDIEDVSASTTSKFEDVAQFDQNQAEPLIDKELFEKLLLRLSGVWGLWNDLPQVKYWLLLVLVGIVFIANVVEDRALNSDSTIDQVKVLGVDGSVVISKLPGVDDESVKPTIDLKGQGEVLPQSNSLNEKEVDIAVQIDEVANAPIEGASVVTQVESKINMLFTGESWVTVKNFKDEIIHNAGHGMGESIEIRGVAPFLVKLGHGPSAEVSFNGEIVDFSRKIRTSSSTAEFTLTP